MKIKAILLTAAILCSFSAFAQEAQEEEATKGPFITNNFGDNWFVGAGLGLDFVLNGPWSKPALGTGFAIDVNGGKWLTPMWGIRAGVKGITAKDATVDPAEGYNFIFVHGDVMWHVQNQFWGYKESRKFQCIPYLTAGLYWPFTHSKNFTVGAGLLNKVALTDRLDLDIDLTGLFIKDASVSNTTSCSGKAAIAMATVGVSYKIGVKTWETKAAAVAPLAVAAAEAVAAASAAQQQAEEVAQVVEDNSAALDSLQKENDALKDEVAAQDDVLASMLKGPHYVYFEIGQAKLSAKELAHFDHIVNTIVKNGKGVTFTVTGNADPATGSKARNKQLSKMRANYIANLLTDKYGMDADQFEVVYNGGMHLTDSYELDRAVLIEVKDE